jgi:hypothetical protein
MLADLLADADGVSVVVVVAMRRIVVAVGVSEPGVNRDGFVSLLESRRDVPEITGVPPESRG